jgi:hypothetical protein
MDRRANGRPGTVNRAACHAWARVVARGRWARAGRCLAIYMRMCVLGRGGWLRRADGRAAG